MPLRSGLRERCPAAGETLMMLCGFPIGLGCGDAPCRPKAGTRRLAPAELAACLSYGRLRSCCSQKVCGSNALAGATMATVRAIKAAAMIFMVSSLSAAIPPAGLLPFAER